MKRAVALAIAALAITPTAAGATPLRTFRLPAVAPLVVYGPCPGLTADGCTEWNGTVHLADSHNHSAFWHEQGHAFDFLRLTWPQRQTFRSLAHVHGRNWFDPYGSPDGRPNELFAEAFASCAYPERQQVWAGEWGTDPPRHARPEYHGIYGFHVTLASRTKICRWLVAIPH